jgi:hypothetical protein
MMKKYPLLLLIITFSAAIYAQSKEKKGFIGILIGPSFPVGNFADNSPTNENAGFANMSRTNLSFDFGYRLGKNIGISASYFSTDHKIDSSANDLSWGIGGITLGPMWSVQLANKFFMDMRLNFGYITASILMDDPKLKDYIGHGLGIDTRATIRYNLLRRWCIIAEAGYLSTQQKFNDGQKKKIQDINFGLGFGFRL